jgi:hypothetical protein
VVQIEEDSNRMDRIDRIKAMQKAEGRMMNEKQHVLSFIIHHSYFIITSLSCLSCPSC